MSALPSRADICSAPPHVRFGPKADSCTASENKVDVLQAFVAAAWPSALNRFEENYGLGYLRAWAGPSAPASPTPALRHCYAPAHRRCAAFLRGFRSPRKLPRGEAWPRACPRPPPYVAPRPPHRRRRCRTGPAHPLAGSLHPPPGIALSADGWRRGPKLPYSAAEMTERPTHCMS